jgi:protoheme ferro-lyase
MQDIIRLPWLFRFLQRPLAKLISVLRAPKSKEGYASIGGGSPLRKITDELVECMSSLRIRIQSFLSENHVLVILLLSVLYQFYVCHCFFL